MILIDNKGSNDPAINLALEDYALATLDLSEDHVLFYINRPSVIIGKHQNTYEEVNQAYLEHQNIDVVRRLSGGGAVYHDYGNLNYSILTTSQQKVFNDYLSFTEPVIRALRALGVQASLTGRNDIAVDGRKISGNAQYRRAGRIFCHGTLLFDTNLDVIPEVLTVRYDKIVSKGIKSVRSRVANISEFLHSPMTIEAFRDHLISELFSCDDRVRKYSFNAEDWLAIEDLANKKYRDWDWNYGKSPDFDIQNRQRFDFGELDVRVSIKQGRVEVLRIFGDFFSSGEIKTLEDRFHGLPYTADSLRSALSSMNLSEYFPGVTEDQFLVLLGF